MTKKPLTGWLILLILILSVGSISNGGPMLITLADSYQPHFTQFPALSSAVRAAQIVFALSIGLGVYSAWIFYRRKPGSLFLAQNCFLGTVALRIAAGCAIPMFGGLPPAATSQLMQGWTRSVIIALGFTIAWYLYLSRSKRVHDIYNA